MTSDNGQDKFRRLESCVFVTSTTITSMDNWSYLLAINLMPDQTTWQTCFQVAKLVRFREVNDALRLITNRRLTAKLRGSNRSLSREIASKGKTSHSSSGAKPQEVQTIASKLWHAWMVLWRRVVSQKLLTRPVIPRNGKTWARARNVETSCDSHHDQRPKREASCIAGEGATVKEHWSERSTDHWELRISWHSVGQKDGISPSPHQDTLTRKAFLDQDVLLIRELLKMQQQMNNECVDDVQYAHMLDLAYILLEISSTGRLAGADATVRLSSLPSRVRQKMSTRKVTERKRTFPVTVQRLRHVHGQMLRSSHHHTE